MTSFWLILCRYSRSSKGLLDCSSPQNGWRDFRGGVSSGQGQGFQLQSRDTCLIRSWWAPPSASVYKSSGRYFSSDNLFTARLQRIDHFMLCPTLSHPWENLGAGVFVCLICAELGGGAMVTTNLSRSLFFPRQLDSAGLISIPRLTR